MSVSVSTLRSRISRVESADVTELHIVLLVAAMFVGERIWPRLTGHALGSDPTVYMVGGVKLAHGQLPYAHLWDIKPPAIHETIGIAAVVTGSNPELLYVTMLGLTAGVILGTVAVIYQVVEELTGNTFAAAVGGLAYLTYPGTLIELTGGPRVKYFAAFFGLLAILLYIRERPLATGITSALAAAYWQPVIVVPMLCLVGYTVLDTNRSWGRFGRFSAGVIGTTLVVISPWLVTGTLDVLVGQTVLAPLIGKSGSGAAGTPTLFVEKMGYFGTAVATVGVVGILTLLRRELLGKPGPRGSLLLTGLALLSCAIALVQTGGPDLIWFAAAMAPMVGVVVALLPRLDSRRWLRAGVTAVLLVSIVSGSAVGGDRQLQHQQYEGFWDEKSVSKDCHYRKSGPERRYVGAVDTSMSRQLCYGARPDENPVAVIL